MKPDLRGSRGCMLIAAVHNLQKAAPLQYACAVGTVYNSYQTHHALYLYNARTLFECFSWSQL